MWWRGGSYVSLSFKEVTDGAFVAFLKTRKGYQTITVHTDTGPIEVETGSVAIFALGKDKNYSQTILYVGQGTYMNMGNVYLDETLFGPGAHNPEAVAFLSDCSISLTATNSSGGVGSDM